MSNTMPSNTMPNRGLNKRKQRKSRRNKKAAVPKLNLISLMDIFTILVFFLMVNSGEVKVLQGEKKITLPDSTAEKLPKENLVVFIGDQNIIVQGKKVASLRAANASPMEIIAPLKQELNYLATKKPPLEGAAAELGYGVTILGDQKVPYRTLKKILATCAATEFRNVSLAVNRIVEKKVGGNPAAQFDRDVERYQ